MARRSGENTGRYQERNYRNLIRNQGLVLFQVTVKETDLYIQATSDLQKLAYTSILHHRYQLEQYIAQHPEFYHSLVPFDTDELAPPIVRDMNWAAQCAGVGPMAAVAGAMAQAVGLDLLRESPEVIIENGGDIFLHCPRELQVGIYAGQSPLSFRVGLRVSRADHSWGVSTSSGTVGPSLSFGKADAVCVLSPSSSLADAAATAIGNVVQSSLDLPKGLAKAQTIAGLTGVVIVFGEKLGAWGGVELIEI